MADLSNQAITKWWQKTLVDDERGRHDDEPYSDMCRRTLRCVICRKPLETAIRDALKTRESMAMLTTWMDDECWVFAAGLVCRTQECFSRADSIPGLGDNHAEYYCGKMGAVGALVQRAADYNNWEATALRRLVLVCGGLSLIPMPRKSVWRERALIGM